MNHIKFKSGKEYFIKTNKLFKTRFIVTKVTTEIINKVPTQVAITGHCDSIYDPDLKTIIIADIIELYEPVSSKDMFVMWTNYNNAKNPNSIFYDLQFANELQAKITNTLKEKSYIQYGSGKFEPFDYKKMYEIRTDIKAENFKFKVGQEYQLQNGETVRILGRTDTKSYECLICSDGAYRYDRSCDTHDAVDKGRCTATSHELFDPRNIINNKFGNRYIIAKEFCEKENVDMKDLCKIEMDHSVNDIKHKYYEFLKSKNMTSVWSTLT